MMLDGYGGDNNYVDGCSGGCDGGGGCIDDDYDDIARR